MEKKGLIKKVINKVYAPLKKWKIEKDTKHISISIPEVFFHHNSVNDFLRYDMIVRLLAVENYYGINDYGFLYYSKMQEARLDKDRASQAVPNFIQLIESYEENGYNESSEIELDSSLKLIDGSHRIAMAMFHNFKKISAKVRPFTTNVYYSLPWFAANGFSEEELIMLKNKYLLLKKEYSTPFVCTLWHPAQNFFDEITAVLGLFGKIIEVKDYELSLDEYKFYTRMIYATDDIAKWKIEKKIDYMTKEKSCKYMIRKVALFLECPNFRLKQASNQTLSATCEMIKQLIRESYKKRIHNYYHDVIIHIGDNFHQNEYINRFLDLPQIDLTHLLKCLEIYEYVIIKYDTPYMPKDFPLHYPYGKDIDIVCRDNLNFLNIMNEIRKFSKHYEKDFDIIILDDRGPDNKINRTCVRYEFEHNLILQFDVSFQIFGSTSFVNEIFSDSIVRGGIRIPSKSKELVLRMFELKKSPSKSHHRDYIIANINEIDNELTRQYIGNDWNNLIKIQ